MSSTVEDDEGQVRGRRRGVGRCVECGPRVWMPVSTPANNAGWLYLYSLPALSVPLRLAVPGLTLFLFAAHMWDVMSLSTAEQML